MEVAAMDEELLIKIKELLAQSEHLFIKLRRIGLEYEDIEVDESGLFEEEEATVLRHWDKLSSKIAQHLNENIEACTITRVKEQTPDNYTVSFQILQEEATHIITVNYSSEKELLIT